MLEQFLLPSADSANSMGPQHSSAQTKKQLKRSATSLSSRILKLQEEQRHKIGRAAECVSDCMTLVERCLEETRTLSHLLHPLQLDEGGFVSAAKWLVEGFASGSKLLVRCDIASDLPRFGNNTELCLFRVLQESLTNAQTLSGCRALNISVQFHSAAVILTVEHDGTGLAPARYTAIRAGTGPLGMELPELKERICDLGGQMYVCSGEHGTTVRTVVPITLRASSADPPDAFPPGVAA
jgi:signal transduction histidine kinase